MKTITDNRGVLREIDIINDREYILSELKKSESEKSYSFEESYNYWLNYINNLWKKYDI